MSKPNWPIWTKSNSLHFSIGEVAAMSKDPVCGMDIEPEDSAGESVYLGETYYFCSVECKQKFDEQPQEYVTHSPAKW
jgi:Cu+-exporting ATPase